MKKFIIFVLVFVLFLCAVGFVACSDNKDDSSDGNNSTDNSEGDSSSGGNSGDEDTTSKTYTIILRLNNPECTQTVKNISVKSGEKFILPILEDTKTYDFEKWQLVSDNEVIFEAMVEYEFTQMEDIEVVAVWSSWSGEH